MAHSLAETNLWYDELASGIEDELEQTGRTVERYVNPHHNPSSFVLLSWAEGVNNPKLKVQSLVHQLYFYCDHAVHTVYEWPTQFEYADPAFPDNLRSRLRLPRATD